MSGILQHSGVPKGHIHGAVNWEFSTYDTLLDYTVLTAQDLHKIAYVIDAGSGEAGYFILDSINTLTGEPTWVSIFGGAGVGSTNLAVGAVTTTTVQVTSDTGTDATLPAATSTTAGVATATQITKLDGIASGATVNATNAELRDRATHTGTQTVATISDFGESVQDLIASTLVAGSNVTLTYDDTAGTLTVASSGGGGGGGSPAVGARVERVAALSAASGASPFITFDTAIVNTDGLYSGVEPTKFTVTSTGWYIIAGGCRWAANSSGGRRIYIVKNATTYLAGSSVPSAATMSDIYTAVSTVAYLSAGDYVELQVNQNAGVSLAFDVSTNVRPSFSIASCTGGSGGGGGATNLAATLSAANIIVTSDTGTDATLPAVDGTNAGLMIPAQFTKLAGVATGATANDTDANLKARANHTGTQTASTISDFTEASQDVMGSTIVAGTNMTVTYDDGAGTITLDASGGGGGATNLSLGTVTATTVDINSDTGTDVTLQASTTTDAGLMTGAQNTKLSGIAAGATANSSDATLLARANHTGTQTASTISDLTESVQDIVGAFAAAGTNMTVTYNDGAGTITFATTATVNSSDATLLARANHTGTQASTTISDFNEAVEDIIGTKVIAGTNVTVTYNDATGETTIDATGGGGGGSYTAGAGIDITGSVISVDDTAPVPVLSVEFPDGNLLHSKVIAGRSVPRWQDASGIITPVQPMFAMNKIGCWNPSGNASSAPAVFGMGIYTVQGAGTARNVASTNLFTRTKRVGWVSNTSVGSFASVRVAAKQHTIGDGSGLGGFFKVMRFGCSDAATVSGARQFVGVNASTFAPSNVEPSTLTDSIGVGHGASDTNLFMYYGGSTAQTPIDLGVDFPANTLSVDAYELVLFSSSLSDTEVGYRVTRLNTGDVAEGTLSGTAGVAIPSSSTLLTMTQAWRCNNATALAVGLDIISDYMETEY